MSQIQLRFVGYMAKHCTTHLKFWIFSGLAGKTAPDFTHEYSRFSYQPPAHFIRSTDADGDGLLPPRPAGAKTDCLRYLWAGLRITDIIISNRYESSARKWHPLFWE